MDEELEMFRSAIARFVEKEFTPHQARWRARRQPDPEAWTKAGEVGMLLVDLPEEHGGGGGTFVHEVIVLEELAKAGVNFASYIQDGIGHYIVSYGSEAQKRDLLPRMARGELVGAIALTEPSSGSDLQSIRTTAKRVGDEYIINGSKTFVTNGSLMSLICMAVRTDPNVPGIRGISMLLIETEGLAGFHRGQPLEKVGMHGQDTCEAFFDDVHVPVSCLLGEREGQGFAQVMERMVYERLAIGVIAVTTMERAVRLTLDYVNEREVAGGLLMELQNTRLKLAECATKAHIGRVFLDDCVRRFVAGDLDSATAAMVKYWLTDAECEVVDECVQLHGGYGYMVEYEIAQMWIDSRVHRIFAGSNEVLKETIAYSL